jgi:Arc/MetJ family transcription regulator
VYVRTNIVLDDELLARAAEIAGTTTKKSTVEFALKEMIRVHAMRELADLAGQIEIDDVRGPGRKRSRSPAKTAKTAKTAKPAKTTKPRKSSAA